MVEKTQTTLVHTWIAYINAIHPGVMDSPIYNCSSTTLNCSVWKCEAVQVLCDYVPHGEAVISLKRKGQPFRLVEA